VTLYLNRDKPFLEIGDNLENNRVEEYLRTHKKIKDRIRKKTKEEARACVRVDDIAKELKIDSKTVKIHLDIMEIDGVGSYSDNKQKIFCSLEGVERLREQIKKKINEKK